MTIHRTNLYVSPHDKFVIKDGHSEIARIYKHDGVRPEEECLKIRDKFLAVDDLIEALSEILEQLTIDDEEGLLTFLDPIQKAQTAIAKARGEKA